MNSIGNNQKMAMTSGNLMRWATYASFATASTLIIVTLVAWAITGSVALLSTLIDALTDAVSSIVNILAVRHALKPADRNFRFGKGKAEPLSGLFQASFTFGSALILLIEAADRIFHPAPLQRMDIGIAVMVFSIIITVVLVRFQHYVVVRTNSVAISAASLHYFGDIIINISVIMSMLLVMSLGWTFVDPLLAIAVSVFLIWNAKSVALESLEMLMDKELPDHERNNLRILAMGHLGVRNVHDLRTRQSGQNGFIQLHLEIDGALPLKIAHNICDEVEHSIMEAYPSYEVTIHQEPA
jgi:ferrous-iron efflux pump FieF